MTIQLELVHALADDAPATPRADHKAIAVMVSEGARVLDIGCGDGALLALLARERRARARGIERDPVKVHACVRRGLSVVQGDTEHDLVEMPSGSFDYVVLSHTLQYCSRPAEVLKQAGRIGEYVIVSIKNAGYWRERLRSFAQGRFADWRSPVLRSSTIRDFAEFARSLRFGIERATPVTRGNPGAPFAKTLWRANWFAEEAVFLLTP